MVFAGIAWHPDPAQTSESVQLVTASADKTACFFSAEGKQLGTLQVTLLIPSACMHQSVRPFEQPGTAACKGLLNMLA